MKSEAKKLLTLLLLTSLAVIRQISAQTASGTVVEIQRINVTGTRCPANSIVALSGLRPHDKVSEVDVNTACNRITATGLFKSIGYAYDAYSDHPGVVLNLAIVDEKPLVLSSITPAADEAVVWTALQIMDPIFTRQLPPTEKALAFYERSIEKCLQASGRNDEYATGKVTGPAQGNPSGVVFEIRRYKSLTPNR